MNSISRLSRRRIEAGDGGDGRDDQRPLLCRFNRELLTKVLPGLVDARQLILPALVKSPNTSNNALAKLRVLKGALGASYEIARLVSDPPVLNWRLHLLR